MGLDKKLFEGEIDESFICKLCNQVLLNPVTAGCSHIFCQSCITRKHQNSVNEPTCPICRGSMSIDTLDTTIEFKLKLLNLTIRCSNKCGSTFILADLPDHMEACPNTPVDCEFRSRGCQKIVKRCDIRKHSKECDFRPVECEACGHNTIYKELFTHQSKVRCLEKKLKQQIIREKKAAMQEINKHRERLFRENVKLDQQQRRAFLNHSKSLSYLKKPRVAMQKQEDSDFEVSPRETLFLTEEVVQQHNKETHEHDKPNCQEAAHDTNPSKTPNSSRSGFALQLCSQCNRKFRSDTNSNTACRWHIGPMVQVFGGTCFACGRLDYQPGCTTGFHRI